MTVKQQLMREIEDLPLDAQEKVLKLVHFVYEEIFSIEEVARILKISRRYIHKLIREGKFGAMKIGKEYRIPKSVLDSYFNQASTSPFPTEAYGFGIWADRADLS